MKKIVWVAVFLAAGALAFTAQAQIETNAVIEARQQVDQKEKDLQDAQQKASQAAKDSQRELSQLKKDEDRQLKDFNDARRAVKLGKKSIKAKQASIKAQKSALKLQKKSMQADGRLSLSDNEALDQSQRALRNDEQSLKDAKRDLKLAQEQEKVTKNELKQTRDRIKLVKKGLSSAQVQEGFEGRTGPCRQAERGTGQSPAGCRQGRPQGRGRREEGGCRHGENS